MMWVPSVRVVMLDKVACPLPFTAIVPRLFPLTLSVNVTVPVVTVLLLVTVAVKVTALPVIDGFGDAVTVVVVAAPLVRLKLIHQLEIVSLVWAGSVPKSCQVPF